MNFDLDFYKGKKVFVTGHTGFKGSWLCKMLANAGAIVTGYSLNPPTSPSLFEIAGIEQDVHSVIGDIRDFKTLKAAFDEAQPEMVLHLAAQPIVRDSYKDPAYTYETNVMGTVNILECVRTSNCVKSFLNVTTDKVYLNKEWAWGYRENEELDGLHSNKLAFTKVKKMSLRMGAVLLLFGSAFALLEQVFERKTLEIGMLPNSVLMTLQQKSWSHLWYLYILIGIYLILIPLKRFIDNSSNREICIFTAILIFGNFVIPTINIAFGTKIENYMLFTQYVTYVLLGYIIGGLHAEDNGREKKAIDNITNRGGVQLGLWLFASVIKIIIQYAAVMRCGEGSALILGDRIFTMIQALSVFCLFKKYMDSIHVGRLAKSISRCSFGIYLIHPFFINLLYKMVDITPTNFPLLGIGFAIPLLWFIVFLLSWGGTFIMLKVPGINSLL